VTGGAAPGVASSQPAPRVLATFFGLLMVLAAIGSGGVPALIGSAVALAAVAAGVFYRRAAVPAVIATAATLAISDTSVLFAAACGLSAAAYLLMRYATPAIPGAVTMTGPTVIGMVGFTLTAVAAALVPWRLSWVPLLAPILILAIVVLAVAVLVPPGLGNRAE